VMKLDYLVEIKGEYYSYAHPMGKFGTMGLEISMLNSADVRRDDNATFLGIFTNQDRAISLSYARDINSRFSMGLSLKTIYSRLDTDETSGVAIDIGGLYKTPIDGLNIGIVLQNIDTGIKYTGGYETTPLNFKVGTSYGFFNRNMLLAVDTDNFFNNSVNFRFGGEYKYVPIQKWNMQISARAGYIPVTSASALSGYSAGFGLIYKDYSLDHAMVPYGDLGNAYRTSFTIKF